MDALLLDACHKVGFTWAPRPHNPNQDSKHRPAWFDDTCRVAQRAAWAATQECGRHATPALAGCRAFCQAYRSAACSAHA